MEEKKLTLEESFDRLREIVEDRENPETTLSDAFSRYKEGVGLVKQCNGMIDKVEKEVKAITENGELNDFQ